MRIEFIKTDQFKTTTSGSWFNNYTGHSYSIREKHLKENQIPEGYVPVESSHNLSNEGGTDTIIYLPKEIAEEVIGYWGWFYRFLDTTQEEAHCIKLMRKVLQEAASGLYNGCKSNHPWRFGNDEGLKEALRLYPSIVKNILALVVEKKAFEQQSAFPAELPRFVWSAEGELLAREHNLPIDFDQWYDRENPLAVSIETARAMLDYRFKEVDFTKEMRQKVADTFSIRDAYCFGVPLMLEYASPEALVFINKSLEWKRSKGFDFYSNGDIISLRFDINKAIGFKVRPY